MEQVCKDMHQIVNYNRKKLKEISELLNYYNVNF